MSFPTLGLVSDVRRADDVAPMLRAMTDRCRVVAWHPGLPVDAVFVTSRRAPRALDAARAVGGRMALWHSAGDPPPESLANAAVTIGTDDTADIRVPAPGIDLRLFRAVAPFLRERWRSKFRIDAPVEVPPDLSWRQRRTLLALCPAVAATGTTALEALAFATPLVTDATTAAELGGTPGVDMWVCADPAAAVELAVELGRDQRRAAAVGRAGRRLAERRHDLARPAAALATAFGWPQHGDLVSTHLADLPTPPLARPFTRAAARVGELSMT
jgi:hypothetical protein